MRVLKDSEHFPTVRVGDVSERGDEGVILALLHLPEAEEIISDTIRDNPACDLSL